MKTKRKNILNQPLIKVGNYILNINTIVSIESIDDDNKRFPIQINLKNSNWSWIRITLSDYNKYIKPLLYNE